MALLLANGSMSSQSGGEGQIRKNLIEADRIEAMVALPGQLFTNTQIPACIWLLNNAKTRPGEVLFIDARQKGHMKDRVLRDFSADDIKDISGTYHRWQRREDYQDEPGYCRSATLADIAAQDYILTPGRYVGTPKQEDDGVPFAEKMQELTTRLKEQMAEGEKLNVQIKDDLRGFGYE